MIKWFLLCIFCIETRKKIRFSQILYIQDIFCIKHGKNTTYV
jgi:hypothetical protein